MIESNKVNYHTVSAEEDGQRLDNYLVKMLKGVPKSHVYQIIRSGEVRVDGKKAKPDFRIAEGEELRIPPVRIAKTRQSMVPPREFEIIFEDAGLLVINKPSGIAVHGGSGVDFGVIEQLRKKRSEARYLELVHRLDRETSGVLMIAKKRSVLRAIHEQFRSEHPKKTYLALSDGNWDPNVKRVDKPLRKTNLPTGEKFVRVSSDGQESHTEFEILENFKDATLLKINLLTGRTHQIRVHMSSMGHPVVNDQKYGNDESNANWKRRGLRRLFLHANKLELENPTTGERLSLEAPLPKELESFLNTLRS